MLRGANLIDMVGFRTGMALVIARGTNAPDGTAQWVCRCDCGREFKTKGTALRRGHTSSCGCLRRANALASNTSHGHATDGHKTRTYSIWTSMLARCRGQYHKNYKAYGGRGIRVCERWSDYSNFLADMGEAPSGLTLDRIDNDGNYEPGNCRWATLAQQVANKRPRTRATHCRRGHELTEANIAWRPGNSCRTCRNAYQRARRNKPGAQEAANVAG